MVTALARGPLRQQSTIEVDGADVVITTEFVSDPEAMLVTVVSRGETVLRKSHVALPAADVDVVRTHGRERMLPSLHAHHLRALRELLQGDEGPARTPTSTSARAGVLGSLLVVGSGEVRERVGEDQVPGAWLRVAYLVAGLGDVLASKLGRGKPKVARVVSRRIAAVLVPEREATRVSFVDPEALSEESLADFGVERTATCFDVDLDALRARSGVHGSALYRGHDDIASHDELAAFGLEDVALAVRHVLRETQPAIEHLEFILADRRLFVAAAREGLLFALVDANAPASALFAGASLPGASSRAARQPSEPVRALSAAELVAAANAVVAGLKRSVGGPVIRNYFTKVQKARAAEAPAFGALAVDLKGELRLADANVDAASLGASLGGALGDLLERLSVVAPEVLALDLRAETVSVAPAAALERMGFFPDKRGG